MARLARGSRALCELVEGQEKLNGETGDLSRTTLAKPLSELGKQEQADLARLAERQTQLGEQVDRIGQRLCEAAEALKSSNREAAQEAASTLKSLEKTDPQGRMARSAASCLKTTSGRRWLGSINCSTSSASSTAPSRNGPRPI